MSDSSDDGALAPARGQQLKRRATATTKAAAKEQTTAVADGNATADAAAARNNKNASTSSAAAAAVAALPLSSSGKLSKKKLKKLKKKSYKRGVIYISRIPPNMRPQKVRHLLSEYGEVGRVYLAAEDAAVRRGKRQSATNAAVNGNDSSKKKLAARAPKRFTEGWVEFEDKEDAKRVAAALNGQPVGGRPRSCHRHDLWCLKYLKGFKWDDLTEEVAAQNADRESRLAAEASAAARERDFYLSRVDEARGREAIRKRREAKAAERERGEEEGGGGGGVSVSAAAAAAAAADAAPSAPRRTFRQNRVVKGGDEGGGGGREEEEEGSAAAKKGRRATAAVAAGSSGGGSHGGRRLSANVLALIAGKD